MQQQASIDAHKATMLVVMELAADYNPGAKTSRGPDADPTCKSHRSAQSLNRLTGLAAVG